MCEDLSSIIVDCEGVEITALISGTLFHVRNFLSYRKKLLLLIYIAKDRYSEAGLTCTH